MTDVTDNGSRNTLAFLVAVIANARADAAEAALERESVTEPRCAHCAAPYTPSRVDSRYCASACRQAAYRIRRGPQ